MPRRIALFCRSSALVAARFRFCSSVGTDGFVCAGEDGGSEGKVGAVRTILMRLGVVSACSGAFCERSSISPDLVVARERGNTGGGDAGGGKGGGSTGEEEPMDVAVFWCVC